MFNLYSEWIFTVRGSGRTEPLHQADIVFNPSSFYSFFFLILYISVFKYNSFVATTGEPDSDTLTFHTNHVILLNFG